MALMGFRRDSCRDCLSNNYVEYCVFAKHVELYILSAKEDVRKTQRVLYSHTVNSHRDNWSCCLCLV